MFQYLKSYKVYKKFWVLSSTETYYQIRQAVILFVNDTVEYYYVIEKEPMNTQVGLFLDKLEFQWSFLFGKKIATKPVIIFVSDQLNNVTHFSSVPQDATGINILHLNKIIQTCF